MPDKRPPVNSQPRTDNSPAGGALDHRLLLYALAAGATLACTTPCHAEVVFTPSNAVLQGDTASLAIDLDQDGSTDFTIAIQQCRTYSGYGIGRCLEAHGQSRSDQVGMFGPRGERLAEALNPGTQVTGGHRFRPVALMATLSLGNWWNVSNRYLGVRFLINGQVHYGWIGFRSVTIDQNGFTATFGGWAYETKPNTPIAAGDMGAGASPSLHPTSLEILSSGHTGIGEYRKRNAP